MKTKKGVIPKYAILLFCVTAALALNACRSAKPVEDDPAAIILGANSKSLKGQPIPVPPPPAPLVLDRAATATDIASSSLPPWASNTIRFEAGAAYPENASSRVQGLALARRSAHDQIVQGMALQIGELSAPGGGTVNDIIKVRPELAQGVEQAIRKGVVYTPLTDDGTQYRESGALLLRSVAVVLFSQKNAEEQ